ncbi:unnamed protein product [Orchesella dallaii]|uniref:7-dehydrocholesterol reductase n=1 Tax=Orchesella dallaii TaxID=48710 RepID=A0ABP1RI84_9HEXA
MLDARLVALVKDYGNPETKDYLRGLAYNMTSLRKYRYNIGLNILEANEELVNNLQENEMPLTQPVASTSSATTATYEFIQRGRKRTAQRNLNFDKERRRVQNKLNPCKQMKFIFSFKMVHWSEIIKYHVNPSIILILVTVSSQFFPHVGNPERPFKPQHLFGNLFSWTFISTLISWAVLWLHLPFDQIKGAPTSNGYQPVYRGNGLTYSLTTIGVLLLISAVNPQQCVEVYQNMGPILGTLNILALTLCIYLFAREKQDQNQNLYEHKKTSMIYKFFNGVELHPRLLGMDVKQLTSPRLGNMMWQLFNLIFFIAGWKLHGFNAGHFVTSILQVVSLCKSFSLEDYYFTMFEMVEDNAGFFLCWGCLVWLPSFYTFQSYFLVHHQPNISNEWAGILFLIGLLAIYFNYDMCMQKRQCRKAVESGNKEFTLWRNKPIYISAKYLTPDGIQKETQLLVAGWWGVARRMNYTFEFISTIMWSLPGVEFGIWCWLYFIFVLGILVHRTVYRDEVKCSRKYGRAWVEYCKRVPYRFIPTLF